MINCKFLRSTAAAFAVLLVLLCGIAELTAESDVIRADQHTGDMCFVPYDPYNS